MSKLFVVLGPFFSMIGVSQAAVDAAVTTALTDAGTDSATIAVAVLVVLVGIAAIRYAKKAL